MSTIGRKIITFPVLCSNSHQIERCLFCQLPSGIIIRNNTNYNNDPDNVRDICMCLKFAKLNVLNTSSITHQEYMEIISFIQSVNKNLDIRQDLYSLN